MPQIAALVLIAAAALTVLYLSASGREFDDPGGDYYPMNVTDGMKLFAKAIAHAEGSGVAGAIPTLANNPGDLVIPNWQGGKMGSEGVSILTADTSDAPLAPWGGWYRLYRQINLIVIGRSHVYSLSDTIADVSKKWTSTQQDAWAKNVADYIGAPVETPLSSIIP